MAHEFMWENLRLNGIKLKIYMKCDKMFEYYSLRWYKLNNKDVWEVLKYSSTIIISII